MSKIMFFLMLGYYLSMILKYLIIINLELSLLITRTSFSYLILSKILFLYLAWNG
jgi:hypothetical protein